MVILLLWPSWLWRSSIGRPGRDAQAIELYNELTAKPRALSLRGSRSCSLRSFMRAQGKPDAAKKIYAQLKDKDAKGAAGCWPLRS